MLPTKALKITIKVPRGTKAGDTVAKKAQAAAQAAVNEYGDIFSTVAKLNAQGIAITVEELLGRRSAKPASPVKKKKKKTRKKIGRKKVARRKVGRKKAGRRKVSKVARRKVGRKKAPRRAAAAVRKAAAAPKKRKSKRTVLSDEQRKALTDRLRAGATAAKAAAEFGVSTATVNNIKRAAGLTKPRAKKAAKKSGE